MARMRARPEVQQCYHVTGGVDFMALVNVRDQAHFSELPGTLLYDNADIARFETCLVVDRAKVGLELPLGRPSGVGSSPEVR